MEKEIGLKVQQNNMQSPEPGKKNFSVSEFENLLNQLPSDNEEVRFLKRMFAYEIRLNRRWREKQDS